MPACRKVFLCGFVLIALVVVAASSVYSANPSLNRPDPVILSGKQLPEIKGAEVGKIRVYAYRGAGWEPIPFQVDEKVGKGRREEASFVIPPETDPDTSFDDNDELVMLARDFGTQAPAEDISSKKLGQKITAQISSANPLTGETVYAYVMVFDSPPARSGAEYVRWDNEQKMVISRGRYEVGYPSGDDFFFDRLAIPAENGGNGANFVDTLKMRANSRVIAQLFVYDVTNADWRNTQIGVINGPVRVIRRVKLRFNSTIFRVHKHFVDVIYYPDFFSMDVPIMMGTRWAAYYQADIRFSLDLADNSPPMYFFNEKNAQSPNIVADGVMSEEEKKMDYRPVKWQCLTGAAGTVLFRLDQALESDIKQDLFYIDDSKKLDPPERYPGHRGDTGFLLNHIEGVSSRQRVYKLTFAFPASGSPEGLNPVLELWKNPIKGRVTGGAEYGMETPPSLPPDDREQPPAASYLPPPITTRTRGYLPQLLIDPNLGIGSGFQVVERNTFNKGLSTDFLFLISHRFYQFYRLEEIYKNFGPIDESRLYIEYILHPNRYFYGIGNDQTPDDLTVFRQERFLAWLLLQHRVTKWFVIGGRFEVMHNTIGHGQLFSGDQPSIEEKYGPNKDIKGRRFGPEVFGLQGGYTNSLEFQLALDFRDDEIYTTKGTYDIFSVQHTPKWLGSDYQYTQYRIDLRYYYGGKLINPETEIPRKLWPRLFIGSQAQRVVAVRFVAQRTDAQRLEFAGRMVKDVPFFNQSYFGDANSSRGHYWAQWIDNDVTFAMFEYRWHMYKIIDGTLFYDVGRVWENVNDRTEWEKATLQDLHSSYGFGLRFNMVPNLMMRIDWGFSRENPGGLMYVYGWHTF